MKYILIAILVAFLAISCDEKYEDAAPAQQPETQIDTTLQFLVDHLDATDVEFIFDNCHSWGDSMIIGYIDDILHASAFFYISVDSVQVYPPRGAMDREGICDERPILFKEGVYERY